MYCWVSFIKKETFIVVECGGVLIDRSVGMHYNSIVTGLAITTGQSDANSNCETFVIVITGFCLCRALANVKLYYHVKIVNRVGRQDFCNSDIICVLLKRKSLNWDRKICGYLQGQKFFITFF